MDFDYNYSYFIPTENRLFSATVADINSRDPLIYSQPMRTEQHDSQWLNGELVVCM